jgi:purine-nucleoside phosphorylase
MTPHNEAAEGDYAPFVLLPGDPLRAKWIAETFFDNPRLVNQVRGALGYSGSYKGVPVSVQATGMGQPSTAIYVHELLNYYGVKTLIRTGTCGGIAERVKLRDLVIAVTASTDSSINRAYFQPFDFSPCADFGLLRKSAEIAERLEIPHHIGGIVSNEQFYNPAGPDLFKRVIEHGALAVEMETSMLYTLASRFGARALSICTMTDSMITGEGIDAVERQTSLKDMVRLALEIAAVEAGK